MVQLHKAKEKYDPKSLGQQLIEKQNEVRMASQPLDHSIFLVGWGYDEDLQMSYWIVRNSYGDGWGMNGDFHVRRGFDDFGIESELTGYQLSLVK